MSHLNFIEQFFVGLSFLFEYIFIVLDELLLNIDFLFEFLYLFIPFGFFITKILLIGTLKYGSNILDLMLVLGFHKLYFVFPVFDLILIGFDVVFELFIEMILC